MGNKREPYIDIVKGLSIICIVMLHYENATLFPNCINKFIGSFMITAFYVTSGWVSAMNPTQRTMRELIRKRWKQLGVPYLWWTALILVFDFVLFAFGYYDTYFIGREIYKAITLRGIGTLWFLPALYGGEIIWYWIKKHNRTSFILIALILSLLYRYCYGHILGDKTETFYRIIDAPFRTISNILGAWIGIAFGFYSYKLIKGNPIKSSKGLLAILGLIFCSFAFISANYLPSFLSSLWILFAPLWGPLGLLFLAKSAQNWIFMNFFKYWGVNSLNLMVTHYSVILVLFKIIIEEGFCIPFKGWTTLICFVLSMPFQYLLVTLINKYAKFTLGK